ncbi:MAG TPA: DUF2278 family protein, partial [Thermoanaerobaculia bacterium]|nr:DUF2278 family protein [Thermoanaerobaculia bacterium]
WRRSHEGSLTHSAYAAIGHLAGAIATHADKELEKLTKDEQRVARNVLLRLVRPGRGAEATKRPCAFKHLPDESASVVRKLADARLVVTSLKAGTEEKVAELAHEALIRQWGRLAAWIAEEETFLVWRDRLRVDIERWEESQHSRDLLLRGRTLREAQAWRKSNSAQLSNEERDFVKRSDRRHKAVILTFAALFLFVVVLPIGYGGWLLEQFLAAPGPQGALDPSKHPPSTASAAPSTAPTPSVPEQYGYFMGWVIDRRMATATDSNYELNLRSGSSPQRVSINLRPQNGGQMLYFVREPFKHDLTALLGRNQRLGFMKMASGTGVDYLGHQLVSREEMQSASVGELNDRLDALIKRVQGDLNTRVYVFGDAWYEGTGKDKVFGFTPSEGIHHVQLNPAFDARDGALFIHFADGHWAAAFFADPNEPWPTGTPRFVLEPPESIGNKQARFRGTTAPGAEVIIVNVLYAELARFRVGPTGKFEHVVTFPTAEFYALDVDVVDRAGN